MKISCLVSAVFLFALVSARAEFEFPQSVPVVIMDQELSLTVPDFRPVGWSHDGKLAWIEVVHIEGRGGEDVKYVIFDAVEDVIVWSLLDNSSWEEAEQESVVEVSWKRMRSEFSEHLVAHDIEHHEGMEIRPFPMSTSGETYRSEVQIGEEAEPAFYDFVGWYSVTVSRDGHGNKRITFVEEVTALGVWVLGYIQSPFESRIAVVVAKEIAGWEGPPNRIDLVMYGCNLLVGFR